MMPEVTDTRMELAIKTVVAAAGSEAGFAGPALAAPPPGPPLEAAQSLPGELPDARRHKL
jgi:hypothetical protein